jgi:hypothetical protein
MSSFALQWALLESSMVALTGANVLLQLVTAAAGIWLCSYPRRDAIAVPRFLL